jgi:hypothetical protein
MNKSFKDRLAALEALETQAELDRSPLTDDDRRLIGDAIALYAVTLDGNGYLVRSRDNGDTAATDRAVARCNAALATLRPRLTTLDVIDIWLRDLEDPATFDEDELLYWVWYGLMKKPPLEDTNARDHQVSFSSGTLRSVVTCAGGLPGWWTQIAELAAPILKARELAIFPLYPSDIRTALALIDSGEITCKPPWSQSWRSHTCTIQIPRSSEHDALRRRVAHAFDEYMHQVSGALIETTDELRADLVAALEQYTHEEPIETA